MSISTALTPGALVAGLGKQSRTARTSWFERVVFTVVAFLLLLAVFGPLLAPMDPYRSRPTDKLIAPGAAHWFGTDQQGRDILSRLLTGARATLLSALLIVVAAAVIGILVATAAAVGGRWVDQIIMRMCDIALALPALVLALGIAVALSPGLTSAIIAMIFALWPSFARITRSAIRQSMSASYVEGARCMGASKLRLMFRHVLPNSLDIVIVQAAFDIGGTTIILAGLSYIGVGAQPPSAEWGAMASDGASYIVTAWWAALIPGLAITIVAITFGLFGDILQVRRDPALVGKTGRP